MAKQEALDCLEIYGSNSAAGADFTDKTKTLLPEDTRSVNREINVFACVYGHRVGVVNVVNTLLFTPHVDFVKFCRTPAKPPLLSKVAILTVL